MQQLFRFIVDSVQLWCALQCALTVKYQLLYTVNCYVSFFYKNFILNCVIIKLAAAAVLYYNEVYEYEIGRIWNFCKRSSDAN